MFGVLFQVALTTTFHFTLGGRVNEIDQYWKSFNNRGNMTTLLAAIQRTAFQRIFELIRLRAKYENVTQQKCTPAKLADFFAERATMSPTSPEKITLSFIDQAFSLWNRVLSIPAVRSAISWCENNLAESPFNSVSKMHAYLVRCGKDKDVIEWVFCAVADKVRSEQVQAACLSVRAINPPNGSGFADYLVKTHALKHHLSTVLLTEHPFKPSVVAEIRSKLLHTHAEYRSTVKPYPATNALTSLPCSWLLGWDVSSLLLVQLIEAPSRADPLTTTPRRPQPPPHCTTLSNCILAGTLVLNRV